MEEQHKWEVEEKLARYDELERKCASQRYEIALANNAMHGLDNIIK